MTVIHENWLRANASSEPPAQAVQPAGDYTAVPSSSGHGDCHASEPSCQQLFLAFLRLGTTAFGGPSMVAYIRRRTVEQERWLTGESFDAGVALCQTIPGATAMQMAAYVGLATRGLAGAAVSFAGFGLPAFALMLALSALYERLHNMPAVAGALGGLQAIIVALMFNATLAFGKVSLKQWRHFLIAGLAAALFGFGVHPLVDIGVASILGLLLNGRRTTPTPPAGETATLPHPARFLSLALPAVAAGLLALFLAARPYFHLAALMLRVDLFAFGGGFASVPLMFHEVVDVRHWLDGPRFMDGIVLGQVTPGPIVITSTFVGFLHLGLAGAAVATLSMFTPSFLLVVAIAPYYHRLRTSPVVSKMISGVLCSFVGMLLAVTIHFARDVAWTIPHLLLAIGAFIALLLRVDILWVVLTGIGVSLVMLL